MDNPYWTCVEAIAERQRAKGIKTYKQGLEANKAPIIARIDYLEEELIDALMYCEWIKDFLKNIERMDECDTVRNNSETP